MTRQTVGAIREVEEARDNTLRHWEEFRPEDLEEAVAAHRRGESLDIDEAFAQMKGISVEELRRRLEAKIRSAGKVRANGAGAGAPI